jgi:large subunit ribosomal protein L2
MAFFKKSSSSTLWRGSPIRSLCFVKKVFSGRNNFGRITIRHRQSGVSSKVIRLINFKLFNIKNDFAQIIRFERDPNRTVFLALVRLLRSGFLCYIPALSSMKLGHFVAINPGFIKRNFFFKLKISSVFSKLVFIQKGSTISNISLSPLSRSVFCRSAGSKAKLQAHYPKSGFSSILLPSGKTVLVPLGSSAYISENSNQFNYLRNFYKAGQTRYLGYRPEVRGVAMNPIDHPHGGGEGKTSGGRSSVSPWGVLTKGYKTTSLRKLKLRAKIRGKHFLLNKNF